MPLLNTEEEADGPPLFIILLGTTIHIPLENIRIGGSFFIPIFNSKLITQPVRRLGKQWGYKLIYKEEISLGMLGVRFWRVA